MFGPSGDEGTGESRFACGLGAEEEDSGGRSVRPGKEDNKLGKGSGTEGIARHKARDEVSGEVHGRLEQRKEKRKRKRNKKGDRERCGGRQEGTSLILARSDLRREKGVNRSQQGRSRRSCRLDKTKAISFAVCHVPFRSWPC